MSKTNGENEMKNTAQLFKELMEGWMLIEGTAKEQFPKASKEEIYGITKGAMEAALKLSKVKK